MSVFGKAWDFLKMGKYDDLNIYDYLREELESPSFQPVGECSECGTPYDAGQTYAMPGDRGIRWYSCMNERCGASMPISG